jgi:nucleoside-diphosphate-sugar epimerase
MKNVVITGSSGLIGTACVEKFLKEGWNVIGVDNFTRARLFGDEADTHSNLDPLKKEKNFTFIESDIRNNEVINIGNPNKITGSESILQHIPLPQDDPQRRYQITIKVQQLLNWSSKVNLETGLKKTIHYMTSEVC